MFDMGVHGAVADAHLVGCFLVAVALHQVVQHITLSRGKLLAVVRVGTSPLERLHYFAGDVAGHGRAAGIHILDGGQQFRRADWLEQIAGSPGGERFEDAVRVVVDCKHEDLHAGKKFGQPANALDAIHAGQVDVHQHDLGRETRNLAQGILSARKSPDTAAVGCALEDARKTRAQRRIIFHNRDSNRHDFSRFHQT